MSKEIIKATNGLIGGTRTLEVIEALRILGPLMTEAVLHFEDDTGGDVADFFEEKDGFDRWVDTEKGFPFTECHGCDGDVGTPRKWIAHVCPRETQ